MTSGSGGGGPGATDLDRWRQLADAATAAPWKVWSHGRRWVDIENNWDEWLFRAGVGPDFEDDMMPADYAEAVANAEFIAEARTAVPALVAAVVAERERADTAEAESAGNARGLLYWNRRYVETERQAAVDVADRDKWRERADTAERELLTLRVAVETGARLYWDNLAQIDTANDRIGELTAERAAAEAALTRAKVEVLAEVTRRIEAQRAEEQRGMDGYAVGNATFNEGLRYALAAVAGLVGEVGQ